VKITTHDELKVLHEIMLHNIPYLTITKKTKVYGYRRRIPEDVRFLFDGKREIVKSFKTKNLSLAQIKLSQWNEWYDKRIATVGYTRKQDKQLPVKLVREIHDDLKKMGQHPEDVPRLSISSDLEELEQFSADVVAIKTLHQQYKSGEFDYDELLVRLHPLEQGAYGKILGHHMAADMQYSDLLDKYSDTGDQNTANEYRSWDEQDPEVIRYRLLMGENLLPQPTWQNAVDDYVRQYHSSPKQRSEQQKTKHTRAVISQCEKISRTFPDGMKTALHDIDAEDVRDFIRQDDVQPSTKAKNLTMLRAVWNSWSRYNPKQVVEGDPFMAEIILHKSAIEETEVNRRSFTPSEFRQFNDSLSKETDQEVRLVGKIAAYCGAPTGDIVKLERKDVKLSSDTPHLVFRAVAGKGRIARSVPLLDPVKTELETYINEQCRNRPTDLVFTSKVVRSSSDLSKKLTVHITNERPNDPLRLVPYSLRHTFKDRAEAAMDSRYVQYLIGHKTKDSSAVHQKYGTGVPPSVLVDGMVAIQSLKDWGMFEEFD
jgi:integrase